MGNEFCCGGNLRRLQYAILINMDDDKTITNEKYNKYFKTNNSIEGVKEIIKNNEFYINGFPIPGTEEEFLRKTPEGFEINKKKWLTKVNREYIVNRQKEKFKNYDDATFKLATSFNSGLEIRLFDLDEDNYTDHIELYYVEAVIINEIKTNNDGTLTIYKSNINENDLWENDGKIYDGDNFTKQSKEKIYDYNFNKNIKKGDLALFSFRPEGWIIEKGKVIKGILIDGSDHEFYQIGALKFQDAMRFSRDNIIISNRCGEYYNVHKYFNFLNNNEGLNVNLWFINSYDENRFGAPCAFTSGQNAKKFLAKAIDLSKEKLNSVVVSDDGNVEKGIKYVNQIDYDSFKKAILRAENVFNRYLSNEVIDFNLYLLYFANAGSNNDIGAKFAGFNYEGFDNQIKVN